MDLDHFLRDVLEVSKLCLRAWRKGEISYANQLLKVSPPLCLAYALIKHQNI